MRAGGCGAHAARRGALSLVVQTNSGIDLHRGIDGDEISRSLFAGCLQGDSLGEQIQHKGGQSPGTLLELAIAISTASDKAEWYPRA